MTMPHDCDPEVFELLRAAAELPHGREQVTLLEQALATAQRLGGFDNEYWARNQLIEALYYAPRERATLTHYAWLRRALDTAGDRLDTEDRAQVLWKLKWAMDHVIGVADLDLATVRATIDDVEGAFRAHGYRLRPVMQMRHRLAEDLDDPAGQAAAVAVFRREPRDRLSDCHACERSFEADLVQDRPAEALAAIEPILRGELTCAEQPGSALAQAIGWHVDLGDHEAAVAAYRRGWPLIKDDSKMVLPAARVLIGLVRLGELDRAIDALVPRLGWLDGTDDDAHRRLFAAAGALVLGAAIEHGLAPELVGGRPAATVRDDLRERAYAVAAAFDTRNGTTVHRRQVERVLATQLGATPSLPPLRLGTDPGTLAGPGPAGSGSAGAGRSGSGEGGAGAEGLPDRQMVGIAEHAEALREQLDLLSDDIETLLQAWRDQRPELLAGLADDDPAWADVALLDRIGGTGLEPDAAEPLLSSALGAARRAGDSVAERRAELELALLALEREAAASTDGPQQLTPDDRERADHERADHERADHEPADHEPADHEPVDHEALDHEPADHEPLDHGAVYAEVAAIAEGLEAQADWVNAAAAWRRIGLVFRSVLEIDLARTAFERALPAQRLAGPPLRVALVLTELSQLLPGLDPARAQEYADEAAEIAEAAGHRVLIAVTADLRARLACQGGDFDTAHELLSAALPAATGGSAEVPLRLLHADVCIDRQDWATLEQQGRALVALGQARRDQMLLTLGQRHLGLALVETGHHAEAAELLEAAIARARIDEPLLVGPVGWALGNALSGAGEPGAARTAYASSATAFEAAARPDEAAHAQARAGDCAWDIGDTLAAGAHYEAAVQHARVAGSVDVYATALRSLAALRVGGGELAAGLADLDAVPALTRDFAAEHGHEDADEWPERLGFGIARQGARLLLGAGEPHAAATRLAALEPTLVGEAAAVVRAERGSYLAAGGDLAGAEPLLVEALPLLDAEHLVGFRVDCAGRWAQALHDAGQVERADEVWQRFGG